MKQFFSIGAIIVSLIIVTLESCAQKTSLVLTKEGVGCLKFGMKFDKIPPACEGFYDRIERKIQGVEGGDAEFLYFYLGNVLVAETNRGWGETGVEYDHSEDVLYEMTIYSSNISTPEGVYPKMPIKKLLMFEGVEGYSRSDFDWTYSLGLSGYMIYYDETDLTDLGKKIMNDEEGPKNDYKVELKNSYFKPNAKVGSISVYAASGQ